MEKICKYCGDPFQTKDRRKEYCTPRCKTAAFIARRQERRDAARIKVCPVCGSTFQAKNMRGVYCSDGCKMRAYRSRTQGKQP